MADVQGGSSEISVETQHDDMVHDAQLDYYGRKLATCSSDSTIKIFENSDDRLNLITTLTGHTGPVWQVAWSHPRYGETLASASYDGTVIIYRGTNGTWAQAYTFQCPEQQSFNSVAWAPQEYGLVLAAACSDGKVYIIRHDPSSYNFLPEQPIDVSNLGTNAVSWAPAVPGSDVWRLVTGSCDNHVTVWEKSPSQTEWVAKQMKDGHVDWVRDVAWAPISGLPYNMIASAGEDGKVLVWTEAQGSGEWQKTEIKHSEGDNKPPAPVWRVSWSVTGNVLAVSSGDQRVTMYKQDLGGKWVEWHWQKAETGRWEGATESIAGGR